MNRLKVYRACLWGALVISVATLFFYCKWYLQTRVPDVIRVGTEEEVQVVDLGFKQVSVQTLQSPRVIPGGKGAGRQYCAKWGLYSGCQWMSDKYKGRADPLCAGDSG